MGVTPLYKIIDTHKFSIKSTGMTVKVSLDSKEYIFEIFKTDDTYFLEIKSFSVEIIYTVRQE